MVNKGYGYRMYLDDLPSATIMGENTYYDTHIPLGYIVWRKENPTVPGIPIDVKPKPRVFIYNHLDIEVIVQETMVTEAKMTTNHKQFLDLDFSEQFGSAYSNVKVKIP